MVVADIDGRAADAVVPELGESEVDALAVVNDVSQQDSTENVGRAAVERFGFAVAGD